MSLITEIKAVVTAQANVMCQEIASFEAGSDYERLTQDEKDQLTSYCDSLMAIKNTYDGISELVWPKNECKIFYTFR